METIKVLPDKKGTKRETFHHIYKQDVLKATEGGRGTATLKRAFKKKIQGIHFELGPSYYVGYTAVFLFADTKADMRKAAKVLVNFGYADSIKEVMSSVAS